MFSFWSYRTLGGLINIELYPNKSDLLPPPVFEWNKIILLVTKRRDPKNWKKIFKAFNFLFIHSLIRSSFQIQHRKAFNSSLWNATHTHTQTSFASVCCIEWERRRLARVVAFYQTEMQQRIKNWKMNWANGNVLTNEPFKLTVLLLAEQNTDIKCIR